MKVSSVESMWEKMVSLIPENVLFFEKAGKDGKLKLLYSNKNRGQGDMNFLKEYVMVPLNEAGEQIIQRKHALEIDITQNLTDFGINLLEWT